MDNLLRHTIRNDMNIVDGTAERIVKQVDDAVAAASTATEGVEAVPADVDLAELAADLIDHAETVRRVADDLLTTAEKQRGVIDLLRQHESPQPLRVAPLVERAVADAVGDAGEAPADVTVSCPDDARAFTHPELDYAIAELIENAIEHAEAAPTVEIEVTAPADRVEIAVRDNAPPIPPDERDPITDRWKMDDLRHTGGMGLWLVYWIADRSGGDLAFDAGADGNEVTISVPDADGDPSFPAADRGPPPVSEVRSAAAEPDGGATAPAAGSEAVTPDTTDAESVAAEATDAESVTSESVTSESVTSESAANCEPADGEPAANREPSRDRDPDDSDAASGPP
jgi:hypothetical protein